MSESTPNADADALGRDARDTEPLDAAPLEPALLDALAAFTARDRVLIALDFDGTLAPEVDDPQQARALPAAHDALLRLSAMPGTTVALLSGRSLTSLAAVSGLPDTVPLVGSHGLELRLTAGDARPPVDAADRERVLALRSRLEPLVAATAGAWIEEKPAGFAVHVRLVDPAAAAPLLEDLRADGLAVDPDAVVRDGKNLIEFSVRDATKGDGLRALRASASPGAVLFAGDDVTDEDALAVLEPGDVGIKVGSAPSVAPFRVADPSAVARLLQRLVVLREPAEPGR